MNTDFTLSCYYGKRTKRRNLLNWDLMKVNISPTFEEMKVYPHQNNKNAQIFKFSSINLISDNSFPRQQHCIEIQIDYTKHYFGVSDEEAQLNWFKIFYICLPSKKIQIGSKDIKKKLHLIFKQMNIKKKSIENENSFSKKEKIQLKLFHINSNIFKNSKKRISLRIDKVKNDQFVSRFTTQNKIKKKSNKFQEMELLKLDQSVINKINKIGNGNENKNVGENKNGNKLNNQNYQNTNNNNHNKTDKNNNSKKVKKKINQNKSRLYLSELLYLEKKRKKEEEESFSSGWDNFISEMRKEPEKNQDNKEKKKKKKKNDIVISDQHLYCHLGNKTQTKTKGFSQSPQSSFFEKKIYNWISLENTQLKKFEKEMQALWEEEKNNINAKISENLNDNQIIKIGKESKNKENNTVTINRKKKDKKRNNKKNKGRTKKLNQKKKKKKMKKKNKNKDLKLNSSIINKKKNNKGPTNNLHEEENSKNSYFDNEESSEDVDFELLDSMISELYSVDNEITHLEKNNSHEFKSLREIPLKN
ncbi:hypothetical protein M0812_08471 [Anaeramoeba flamelloides]|uniref:PH domain-containing protein n=1 Tax=Anaeramoeba flamelloides TaxID=1746091 RepID=A0AAV7ZZQ7_9EUKA|nr:hypothetical protein M0812_08471 [Anaeramoeba flamelloides]